VEIRRKGNTNFDQMCRQVATLTSTNHVIIADRDSIADVSEFRPYLYKLSISEFHALPTGEYLCEGQVRPISVRRLSMASVQREWRIEMVYVSNLAGLMRSWTEVGARFNAQVFSERF